MKQKPHPLIKVRQTLHRFWRDFIHVVSHKWFRWTMYPLLLLFILVGMVILLNPILFPPVKDYNFGVSFSEKRSKELGLDWQANYLALLDDLQIKKFRLMSYWDLHERERGQFDFSSLDWQMEEARKRGVKVSLSIGVRQPRWPECHQPEWAINLQGGEWKQALFAYVERVVKRYENHPALESWQLENEALNGWFGECGTPDRERINEEFKFVKNLTSKPVWMSLSDQHGLPVLAPHADAYGYSVYRIVYNSNIGPFKFYSWYPTPLWYHRMRSAVIQTIWDRPQFIHELQLEPWGPVDTMHLSEAEQNLSMSADQIHRNVTFARQIGFEDIYTWGGEWWYWRQEKFGDHIPWETVRREINASRDGQ